jgi:hypothetical protein
VDFRVHERIFQKFPEFRYGVVICKGLEDTGVDENLLKEFRYTEGGIRQDLSLESWVSSFFLKDEESVLLSWCGFDEI